MKKRLKDNQIQKLINDKKFMKKLLEYSQNDIDTLCWWLGNIMVYYALSNDHKLDYSIEEISNKIGDVGLYSVDEVKEKGFFTHSCNGCMIEQIKKNGLGCPLNTNDELFSALSRLEDKFNTIGDYTKQQSGRKDEIYFTSAGATSFGYAINFAPERLFLGILKQERDRGIPVEVGESKKDYYRRVLYQKYGENLNDEAIADIETVLNGYFSDSNYIVSFNVKDVISSDNIYIETVIEYDKINLDEHIQTNFLGNNFFTSDTGSNQNSNNMDNLVMINTIIPPEKLSFLRVPDRYDLIQLIAINKGLQNGEKLDYFTFDKIDNKANEGQEKNEKDISRKTKEIHGKSIIHSGVKKIKSIVDLVKESIPGVPNFTLLDKIEQEEIELDNQKEELQSSIKY